MRVSGKIANVQLMQRINRARVLDCVRRAEGTVTRPILARETGLSLSSITNIVTYLLENEILTEQGVTLTQTPGRRASLLALSKHRWRIACITAEADGFHASLCTLTGMVVRTIPADTVCTEHRHLTGEKALNAVTGLLERLLRETDGELLAAAVSVPGMVLERGNSVTSITFQWSDLNLRQELEKRCTVPVFIQNASIARAICVRREIRRDKPRNAVFLDLEHGIGAVHFAETVLDPTFLGELGHVTADVHGERCFCGNRGCLETFCSPDRMAADCGKKSYAEVLKAAENGEESAKEVLRRGGKYLGAAIVTLIQLFAPDILYIHGHELLKSTLVSESAVDYARSHAYPQLCTRIRFRFVSLDADSTLSGLLDYALDRLFDVESSDCILK